MTAEFARPNPGSYWVVPGRFLAGQYPASTRGDEAATRQRLTAFLNTGFDTFFDLTRQGELPPYLSILTEEAAHYGTQIDYRRFPVQDRGLPAPETMVVILGAIDFSLDSDHKIYLHCWGGVGRTGMAVGCYLVRHGLTGEAALARLGSLYRTAEQSAVFPRSPETDEQVDFIRNWADEGGR